MEVKVYSLEHNPNGNVVVRSHLMLTGKELTEGPLCKVVKQIRQSKKMAANIDYIWSSIDMLETLQQEKMKLELSGESIILTDWRLLGLLGEVDLR